MFSIELGWDMSLLVMDAIGTMAVLEIRLRASLLHCDYLDFIYMLTNEFSLYICIYIDE